MYFFQFDLTIYEQYRDGHLGFEEEFPGLVAHDSNNVIEKVIDYVKSDYTVENTYVVRYGNFFAYRDKDNSERIYNAILQCREEVKVE